MVPYASKWAPPPPCPWREFCSAGLSGQWNFSVPRVGVKNVGRLDTRQKEKRTSRNQPTDKDLNERWKVMGVKLRKTCRQLLQKAARREQDDTAGFVTSPSAVCTESTMTRQDCSESSLAPGPCSAGLLSLCHTMGQSTVQSPHIIKFAPVREEGGKWEWFRFWC